MVRQIHVLGICASPRRPSNSEFLLEQALTAAAEAAPECITTEAYLMRGKQFHPCNSCYDRCRTLKGDCTAKDSFQELQHKWHAADAIIYSVPVYHVSYPAQLHCFLDRLGCTNVFAYEHHRPPKLLKPIGVIAQGSHLFSGQEQAIMQLIQHALIMGCIPVAGDMWEAYFGAAGSTHCNSSGDGLQRLYEDGDFDAKAAVTGARSVGRRAAEMALIVSAGAVAWKQLLAQDPLYEPLFQHLEAQPDQRAGVSQ